MVDISEHGRIILEHRYLLRNESGVLTETVEGLFGRVAKAISQAELKWSSEVQRQHWEQRFFEMMCALDFLPNSPTLMNAGLPSHQLSACFVLPVEDSLSGIFTSLKNAALIHQSGGGTGFNFSQLRPKNDRVSRSAGTASGPVSFMRIFDEATEHVKQGGRRRGANMGILNIDHPDILDFIRVKKDPRMLRNFNISVGMYDAFMQALEKNESWNLIHPNTKHIVHSPSARSIWDALLEAAWETGDPGIVFLDTINASNATPFLGSIDATNPCGEVPLYPYEACNLGSINLSHFLKTDGEQTFVHWEKLAACISVAIRFLDNVIEVNEYLLPEIQSICLANRKIGLGVMGWAEMLIGLGIPYDSESAVTLASELMQFVNQHARIASQELALERSSFPNWKQSIYAEGPPLRNVTRTSIAPTGTISIIAGTSSSIEPLFALAYRREQVLGGKTLRTVDRQFMAALDKLAIAKEPVMAQLRETGMVGAIKELPEETKALFKTAMEIDPEWHVRHQVAFQKHTDNAVSKTINLPEKADMEDIDRIFRMAWKNKAKGITIFRNHSKKQQVLNPGTQSAFRFRK